MAYKKRSPERLEEIEDFIAEWYGKFGPGYCSERLDEPKGYIIKVAHDICVHYDDPEKYKGSISKADRQQNRINELMNINERLRTENIKIIHENIKLKKIVNCGIL